MRTMRFDKMLRGMAPLIMMALASGCSSAEMHFGGEEGVPLADLDLSGKSPGEIALMGPDKVLITQGAVFDITVEGAADATSHLRFVLDDDSLGISRERGYYSGGVATIRVTLPSAPRSLTIAGSGEMVSDKLADTAEVSIAGSGRLSTPQVAADSLDVSIAGSGSYSAAGRLARLDLNIAGSGDANLGGLEVARADISIAGSGDTIFASDGEVKASIMGSGNVTVRGSAHCTLSALGSGKLVCERAEAPA